MANRSKEESLTRRAGLTDKQFLIYEQWVLLPAGRLPKLIITRWDADNGQVSTSERRAQPTDVNILAIDEPAESVFG